MATAIVNRPVLGTVSMVPNPAWNRKRTRSMLLFAGSFSGLLLMNVTALVIAYFHARGGQ